jgi:hypothetical protein
MTDPFSLNPNPAGCTLTRSFVVNTAIEPCCYTRTIGYWSTHGEEMKPWLVGSPITLW